MEGRDPYALRAKTYELVNSLSHFSGCLVRKSNGQDIPRIYIFLIYQITDSVSYDSCFA